MIRNSFYLVLMITTLMLAFITKDVLNSNLLMSIAIIIGAFIYHKLSIKKRTSNE